MIDFFNKEMVNDLTAWLHEFCYIVITVEISRYFVATCYMMIFP